MTFSMIYRNERDVEIPLLLEFVDVHRPSSLLDVGYAGCAYAEPLRGVLGKDTEYIGVDKRRDRKVEEYLTGYHTGDVRHLDLATHEMVSSVSVLEHVGGQPVRAVNYAEQQVEFFQRLSDLAGRLLFVSFPFGLPGFVLGEYNNVTDEVLGRFLAIEPGAVCRFFYNQGAQMGNEWVEVGRKDARNVELLPQMGVRCVCVLTVERVGVVWDISGEEVGREETVTGKETVDAGADVLVPVVV